jgi:hypothetical protein
MEQATYGKLACLDWSGPLLSLFFNRNGVEHLSKLMHIHPSQQLAGSITSLALLEQRMDPACQYESLACCENPFALAGITGGLDRNLVHLFLLSMESKKPPNKDGWIRCRAIYTSTLLQMDGSSTADDETE